MKFDGLTFAYLFVVSAMWFGCETASGIDKHDASKDVFCGARCARQILSHYGRHEDLVDLVRELQWPHLEETVSLNRLIESLEQRGVHTHACRIGMGVDLIGNEPAIVHLDSTDGGDGHFIVWISASADRATITDGLQSPRLVSTRDLATARSGYVLLTSNSPISDPRSRFLLQRRWSFKYAPESSGVALGVVVFCCGYHVYRRRVRP